MNIDLDTTLCFATDLIKKSGVLLMNNFDRSKITTLKARSDIVTDIDIQSEKLMIESIKSTFPDHSILSEEKGLDEQHSKYMWVMDPIDGTINYFHGMSPFRIGLCLLEDGIPIISVVYNPTNGHIFSAQKGKGCMLNGIKINVNQNSELGKSVVMTHLSSKKIARQRTISCLDSIFSEVMHMRMFGSGLAAMTYVAVGKFDVFFNVQSNPWDILPGSLLIEEAGGRVTDIQGQPVNLKSTSVLATNGKVHDEMLGLLKSI